MSPSRSCRQAAGSRRPPDLRVVARQLLKRCRVTVLTKVPGVLSRRDAGRGPDDCGHLGGAHEDDSLQQRVRTRDARTPVVEPGDCRRHRLLHSCKLGDRSRESSGDHSPGTGGQEPAAPAAAGERRRACPRPTRRLGFHRGRAARGVSMGGLGLPRWRLRRRRGFPQTIWRRWRPECVRRLFNRHVLPCGGRPVALPTFWSNRARVTLTGRYIDAPDVRYYGVGDSSLKEDETRFGYTPTTGRRPSGLSTSAGISRSAAVSSTTMSTPPTVGRVHPSTNGSRRRTPRDSSSRPSST